MNNLKSTHNKGSQPKINWWANIPKLTNPMDSTLDYFCKLALTNPKQFRKELDEFCEFMAQHPLAIQHNKSKNAIKLHMRMNIKNVNNGKPIYH